jgi:hypothetical protein
VYVLCNTENDRYLIMNRELREINCWGRRLETSRNELLLAVNSSWSAVVTQYPVSISSAPSILASSMLIVNTVKLTGLSFFVIYEVDN